MMPDGAVEARAEALATLRGQIHQLATRSELSDWFAAAAEEKAYLQPWQQANLREMEREWVRETTLSRELVEAMSAAETRSELAWRERRPRNDLQGFLPFFSEVVRLKREAAQAWGEKLSCEPYDALLDGFEPGLRVEHLAPLFARLREFLPGFIHRVCERQARESVATPAGPFPVERQRWLAVELMRRLGFDFRGGRLDTSAHPFCGGVAEDVRLTLRYDEADALSLLCGALHETGHALYSQNLPRAWRDQPVGSPRGASIHESQSLLLEMQVGRSQAFMTFAAPLLAEAFPLVAEKMSSAFSPQEMTRQLTRVRPGLIRVDADEVTYPCHIQLRFEIEKKLIDGSLRPQDLPEAWDQGMREWLGLSTRGNDRDGCMQDVHWPAGLFGYFPSYTLGALAAAQLFSAVERVLPHVKEQIRRGEFRDLAAWLRENIWSQASSLASSALIERATGRPLGTKAFEHHLQRRYLDEQSTSPSRAPRNQDGASDPCRLRPSVVVQATPDLVAFTDKDVTLTVDLELGDGAGLDLMVGAPGSMRINHEAASAADVVEVLRGAALIEEGLSLQEIRRRQSLFQLRQLFDFITTEIPYYQAQPAFTALQISSLEDLRSLPIMKKVDIRKGFLNLVPRALDVTAAMAERKVELFATSGSTDDRLQSLIGREVGGGPEGYTEVWFGEPLPAAKTAILTTPICAGAVCHLGKSRYEERIREDTLSLNSSQDYFSIDRPYVENVAEELARFQPDILFFDPIYLHWFARRAAEMGMALPPVKLLVSSYQYCSQLQRRALGELFQAPLYDWYSATETAAVVGQECPAGRLHVRPEQCLVEILRENGVAAPGVVGKILVTTLASRTMPLVRYQIGDVGSLSDQPCSCILNGSPCLTLHGRAKDILCVQNRPVTTRQFDQMISDTPHLDFYSCTQTDADTLVVDVIPSLGQESVFAKAELADKLHSRLGIAKVEVRLVSRLDPLPSLKYRQTACAYRDMSVFP